MLFRSIWCLRNLKCLKTKDNKFESYNNCDTSVSSSSNPKKINVVKPEPEVKPNYFVNLWKKISLGWKLFIGLMSSLAIIITVILGLKKLIGGKKSRR